jgi:hypothetical protein
MIRRLDRDNPNPGVAGSLSDVLSCEAAPANSLGREPEDSVIEAMSREAAAANPIESPLWFPA